MKTRNVLAIIVIVAIVGSGAVEILSRQAPTETTDVHVLYTEENQSIDETIMNKIVDLNEVIINNTTTTTSPNIDTLTTSSTASMIDFRLSGFTIVDDAIQILQNEERSIAFPCPMDSWVCQPLEAGKMILYGTREAWADFEVCLNSEADCMPILGIFE